MRELRCLINIRLEELREKAELGKVVKRIGKKPYNLMVSGMVRDLPHRKAQEAINALGLGREETNHAMICFVVARQTVRQKPQPRKRWREFGRRNILTTR